jgi:predicted deacylase
VKLRWRADSRVFTAHCKKGGVFIPAVKLGDAVRKGQEVGYIYSPRTFETLETLAVPQDGYVFSIRQNPVVQPGDGLVSAPEVMGWLDN